MSQLLGAPDYALLLRVVQDPLLLRSLSPSELARAIDAADRGRLLGWLIEQADLHVRDCDLPGWLVDRLITARALAREYERAVRWEINRIDRALSWAGEPWVLLKGGAYIAAGLPPGRGRRVADIDVLVPRDHLRDAEAALLEHGWAFKPLNAYDERYYREWMHELPPMVHSERRSVIDLHYAILPRTSRLQPSSTRLIDASIDVGAGIRVLFPAHMVLHAAAHVFHDGEIAGAIRDIVDLDALLRVFGERSEFWEDFVREAQALALTRPAYYSLRYTQRLLGTPVPADVCTATLAWAPRASVRLLMDALVERTVSRETGALPSVCAYALYVRSHWLRMPPLLLARHLARKKFRRGDD
jgi:hypothetical protein